MKASTKIARLAKELKARGYPHSNKSIAFILGVAPSTITRWTQGVEPTKGKHHESLQILIVIISRSKRDQSAFKLFDNIISGDNPPIRRGLVGVLEAVGLEYIVKAIYRDASDKA